MWGPSRSLRPCASFASAWGRLGLRKKHRGCSPALAVATATIIAAVAAATSEVAAAATTCRPELRRLLLRAPLAACKTAKRARRQRLQLQLLLLVVAAMQNAAGAPRPRHSWAVDAARTAGTPTAPLNTARITAARRREKSCSGPTG